MKLVSSKQNIGDQQKIVFTATVKNQALIYTLTAYIADS